MGKKGQNIQLTCEYLHTPIGIQNQKPRFGWRLAGEDRMLMQIAYRIQVFDKNDNCIWDSGKIKSSRCSAVEYAGNPLMSFGKYYWTTTLWLKSLEKKDHVEIRQSSDEFETGIFYQDEWKGSWICADKVPKTAVPLFRREIILDNIPERARIYLCGIGYCEAWINGYRLGDSFLDPGWTNYNKTLLYRVYDVREYLKKGKNVFAAELGGGWLALDHPAFQKMINRKTTWISNPKLLCNIYLDNKCISTDEDGTWHYSEGPIRFHNLYDGEYYDAAYEKQGYRMPDYIEDKKCWNEALAVKGPGGILRSQIMPPIRKVQEVSPQYIEYIGDDDDYDMTVDFGVNFSGWVQIIASGSKGQKIRLRYGETLCDDHSVNQKNLREAKGEDVFVFGEQKEINYQPHFVYHGFRYVQILIDPGVVVKEIIGCEVHTDIQKAGDFFCSDTVLNNIQKMMQRTEMNNLHSIPTDCPQRDERLGWMNDMTVRFEEGLYNFDMLLFYEKWLQDIEDAQREDGAIPDTVPYFFGDIPARHISSVYLLIPWNLYLFYDDMQILKHHYQGMKKYLTFKLNERNEKGILPERYFGDWAPPMTEAFLGWGENAVPKNLTQSFITTCYLYYDCKIMENVARVLNKEVDERKYHETAEKIADDINKVFYNEESGDYDTGAQGCNAFALFLGIVPKEEKRRVRINLLRNIEEKNYHITTGNQMTKYLYEVLNQEKMDEVAFQISSSKTYPSIGFMLNKGATTIWERWEYLTNKHMNSHNHPMLGAFTVWFYKGLAGIRLDESGNRRIIFRPSIIDKLNYVDASHEFPWGRCRAAWEKKENEIVYRIEIPWNTTATIDLSNCMISYKEIICEEREALIKGVEKHIFTSGNYQFRFILK